MSLCPDCPRAADGLSCGSRGKLDSRLVIVGMSPGLDELAQGRPFVGASGRILARAMLNAGLHPDQAYICNAINCPPEGGVREVLRLNGGSFTNGSKISPAQTKACRQRLRDELARLTQATVVVTLGGEALAVLTNITSQSSKWQNHPLTKGEADSGWGVANPSAAGMLPPNTKWVVPLYHPSYVQRKGMKGEMAALKLGFDKVKRMLSGSYTRLLINERDLGWPLSTTELLAHTGPLAYDIENTPTEITRIGFALYDEKRGCVRSGSWAWHPIIRDLTARILAGPGPKIAHNMAHDIRYLLAFAGIEVQDPVFDTMLGFQALQPEMEKSLDAVSGFLLDVPRWKHLSNTYPELYNRLDAHVTMLLYPLLRQELENEGLVPVFDRMMAGMRVLIRATILGLRLDGRAAERWFQDLEHKVEEPRAKFEQLTGGVNPNSPKQLLKLLYEDLGLQIQRSKGKPTTEEAALLKLQRGLEKEVGKKHPQELASKSLQIIQALLSFRESSKLLSTYAKVTSGTVHPNYFPVGKDDSKYGTATGRLSSQQPNIQNQPLEARRIYVPHPFKEPQVLVEADYSQIELRVAAWRAPEPVLVGMFVRGEDVHAATQRQLQCPRPLAKRITYGTLYGAGARRIHKVARSEGLKITLREVEELQGRFYSTYPGLRRHAQDLVRSACERGFSRNCFGRVRYFYKPQDVAPEIVNFEPQSIVGDILWDRLPEVEQVARTWDGRFLTTVHDSVLLQFPLRNWRAGAKELKSVLEKRFPEVGHEFYCPVDIKVGRNWGNMHKVRGL